MDVQMEKQEEENQEKEEVENNDTVEMNIQNGTTTPITTEAPTQNGTIPDAFRPSIDEEEEDETQMSTSMIEMDDENTQGSVQSSAGESSRISKKSWGTRPLPAEVLHVEIHPSQIIEYEWPLKSGNKFFIQEQIAQLLGVTSFKRKFPGLRIRSEQDENFRTNLCSTKDALLIVCDEKDSELGVGMSDKSFYEFWSANGYKMQDLSDWMLKEYQRPKSVGQNILGCMLMLRRHELREAERFKCLKNPEFSFEGLSTVDENPMTVTANCQILSLSGVLRPLSNYYRSIFDVKEISYRSVEHYAYERLFESLKIDEIYVQQLRSVPYPVDVAAVGIRILESLEAEKPDWRHKMAKLDRYRQTAMKHKISKNGDLRQLLLNTGNAFLVETNPYGDDVWTVNTDEYELQHLLTKPGIDISYLVEIMCRRKDPSPTLKHLGQNKTGILLMELRQKYANATFIPYPFIAPPDMNIQRLGLSNNIICFTPESIFHPFYPVPIIVTKDLTVPSPIHYKEIQPLLKTCQRKECDAPWCNSNLDELNGQYEKLFIKSFTRLSTLLLSTDTDLSIHDALVELKKIFHRFRDIFGKKIFIENHLPTTSKKLKGYNESIEKALMHLVQGITKLQTQFEDKEKVGWFNEIFFVKKSAAAIETNGFEPQKKMSALQKQASIIEESNSKLSDLKVQLVDCRNENSNFKKQINDLSKDVSLKDYKIEELENKISVLTKQIEILKGSTEDIKKLRMEVDKSHGLEDYRIIEFYFLQEVNKVVTELNHVQGKVQRYRRDIDDLTMVLQNLDVEHNESKKIIDERELECQELRDELETIRHNYEEQLRVMSEHLAIINSEALQTSSPPTTSVSSATTTTSNSLKDNLRKIVRK